MKQTAKKKAPDQSAVSGLAPGSTIILPCACSNEYQDARYGPGRRVHNIGKSNSPGSSMARCTVCLTTRGAAK